MKKNNGFWIFLVFTAIPRVATGKNQLEAVRYPLLHLTLVDLRDKKVAAR